MTETNKEHKTLVSGLFIQSVRNVNGTLQYKGGGTLTGLATKFKDDQKVLVLVTNRHVMTGSIFNSFDGDEDMYQADFTPGGVYVPNVAKKVGGNISEVSINVNGRNEVDVAICELEPNVLADFTLHDHPNHSSRKIIGGAVDPVDPADNEGTPMEVLMVGAANGEGTVFVMDADTEMNVGNTINGVLVTRRFEHVVRLHCSGRPVKEGDSGAPCLVGAGENQYKMCCIVYASGPRNAAKESNRGWAFPASKAEGILGFRFGENRPPVATAGYAQMVGLGDSVTLDGSGSTDPEGDTLKYKWEQMSVSERDVIASRDTVTLNNANTKTATFTAPSHATTLAFKLTVTDSLGTSATDTVSVTVLAGAEALGGLVYGQTYTRTGSWSASVASVNRTGRYAKFYGFSLSQRAKVQIDLASSVDPYLYLLAGAGTSGSLLAYNNDVGVSGNSRIIRTLDAGAYTLEATTYAARQVGTCTLAVQVYSNDATLKGLSLSPASASLSPSFATDEESYTASVGNAVTSVRVTPTVNQADATVTVNGTTVASGQSSGPISLSVGKNTITVVVTAEDGTTKKTYTVNVTRAATPAQSTPPPTPTPTPTPTETDPWGPWTDTGNTMYIGGGHWVKEQQRTSSLGNTETQWVLM